MPADHPSAQALDTLEIAGDPADPQPCLPPESIGAVAQPEGVHPKKILFMMSHSAAGGILELWRNLAEGLRSRGHAARVVAFYPDRFSGPGDQPLDDLDHVKTVRPHGVGQGFGLVRDLVRFIRRERPDVIVTAMPAANVLIPIAAQLAGGKLRVIITHHTPVETYNRAWARADIAAGCLPVVKQVVSVSDAVGASLDRRPAPYRAKRVTIHNGLPPAVADEIAALRERRGTHPRGRQVIATGRLAPQKNFPVLIRAAALSPGVQVDILGGGPDHDSLQGLVVELGVADRVRLLGQVSRQETLARLAEADLFIQPSLFEGHSLSLLEAAHMHLPLVVSDVPAQREGVTAADGRCCARICDPHDPAAFATAMQDLLGDPACYRAAVADSAHLAAARTFAATLSKYEVLIGG